MNYRVVVGDIQIGEILEVSSNLWMMEMPSVSSHPVYGNTVKELLERARVSQYDAVRDMVDLQEVYP